VQFGRVLGSCLVLLGLILISLQGWRSLRSATPVETNPHMEQHSDNSYVPGMVGTAMLIAGIAVFASGRRQDEPDPRHAIK
jgi:hypothetical protein